MLFILVIKKGMANDNDLKLKRGILTLPYMVDHIHISYIIIIFLIFISFSTTGIYFIPEHNAIKA